MPYFTRTQWGAVAPRKTLPVSKRIKGVCLHWMGFNIHGDSAEIVRSIQRNHMGKNWFDVAYNELIDLDGNVFEGRGIRHRSGAQGGNKNNKEWVAIGLMLGPGQLVSAEMLESAKSRIAAVRLMNPKALQVVGHQQLKPTQCPGGEVMSLLARGAFDSDGLTPEKSQPESGWPVPERVLFRTRRGNDVKWLQQRLNQINDARLVVDGDFGKKTSRAVARFQLSAGLRPDRIVGPLTMRALRVR